jgi:Domain of unknown function (DUF4157)
MRKVAGSFAEPAPRAERTAPGPSRPNRAASRPLDPSVRAAMEARFRYDFSRVRVHTDPDAGARQALAYTQGAEISFAPGQYRPDTPRGRALLAHELAHVVQQADQPQAEDAPRSSPGEPAERAADTAAATFGAGAAPEPSRALAVRDRLRATRPGSPRVMRVASWAGDFTTDTYTTVNDKAGSIGVDIALRFKPGQHVDATTIGMTQMVTSKDQGKAIAVTPTVGARSIAAGKAGEGAHIDQLEQFPNPLYATGAAGAKDTLGSTPTHADWGQHGFRFHDKGGTEHKQDAVLKDTPKLPGHGPNASQMFETTAVAVNGVQRGTYYGSVQWGWRSDAANKFAKLPLTLVTRALPTGTFGKAAALWAANPTSTGAKTLPLPTTALRFAKVDAPLVTDPANAAKTTLGTVPKNTRLEFIWRGAAEPFNTAAKDPWRKVTVIEGALIGRVGWILSSQLSDRKSP